MIFFNIATNTKIVKSFSACVGLSVPTSVRRTAPKVLDTKTQDWFSPIWGSAPVPRPKEVPENNLCAPSKSSRVPDSPLQGRLPKVRLGLLLALSRAFGANLRTTREFSLSVVEIFRARTRFLRIPQN